MEIEWKPSKLKRQFRTKRQKQTQQRQDTAHYQEHSAKLRHIVILRQSRLATDYADWHGFICVLSVPIRVIRVIRGSNSDHNFHR
jgi:hypothetical protein